MSRILVLLSVVVGLLVSPWHTTSAEAAARCRPVLVSMSVRPTTTVGGTRAHGTVDLSCRPHRPIRVRLRGSAGLHVPASVRVKGRSATFTVRTAKTARSRTRSITASYAGRRRTTHLRITSGCVPTVVGIGTPSVDGTVPGDRDIHFGDHLRVRVTLNCSPRARTKLTVATTPSGLTTGTSVTVPAGSRTPTVPLTIRSATPGEGAEHGTLRISTPAGGASEVMDVVPGLVSMSFTADPDQPMGTATITLGGPAARGMHLSFSSDDQHVAVIGPPDFDSHDDGPAPSTATADLMLSPVSTVTTVTLTAHLGSTEVTTPIVLRPPFDESSTISIGGADLAFGGTVLQVPVDLSNPVPSGGLPLSATVISGPGTAGFLGPPFEGATRAHLAIDLPEAADSLPYDTVVQVTAGNATATRTIHVEPAISSISTPPAYVPAGRPVTLDVVMKGPVDRDLDAVVGRQSIQLSGAPWMTTPAAGSRLIASGGVHAGRARGTVTLTLPAGPTPYVAEFSPGLGTPGMTAAYGDPVFFTVTSDGEPEPVISWETHSVPAGGTAQFAIDLATPMTTDTVVDLSADQQGVSVPSTVVVPAGALSVGVPVSDLTAAGGYSAHVTAAVGAQSVTAGFVVSP